MRGSLYLLLVGGLQYQCVMLWAVCTLKTEAYIAASCHGVVLWFVQLRKVVVDPHVTLVGTFVLLSLSLSHATSLHVF